MADDSPNQPTPPAYVLADLPDLYQRAVETGEAGELVRALCVVHGVNLRGLAELAGVSHVSLVNWSSGKTKAQARTLRDLAHLVRPSRAVHRRIGQTQQTHPLGLRGRPAKK